MAALLEEGNEAVYKDLPYYNAIVRSFFKRQILHLLEELASQTGEEAIILTANINNGTMSHLGTATARGFIDGRDDIKSQFLSYCLTSHHSVSSLTSGSSSSSSARSLTASMCPPKRQRLDLSSSSSQATAISSSAMAGVVLSHTDILDTQTQAPVQKFFTSLSEARPVTSLETKTSSQDAKHAGDIREMKPMIRVDILDELAEQGSAETFSESMILSSSEYPRTGQGTPNITVDGTSDLSAGSTNDVLDPANGGETVIVKTEPVSDELEDCEVMASWTQADKSWTDIPSTMVPTNRESVTQQSMTVYPSSTYTPARRKGKTKPRVNMTLKEKVELIYEHNKDPTVSHRKLAAKYNVGKTAVGSVLRNKNMHLQQYQLIGDTPRKRFKNLCKYSEINDVVWQWFRSAQSNGEPISGPIIQEKALDCAKQLNMTDFKASNGWLHSWKSRYSVSSSYKHTHTNVDILEDDENIHSDDVSEPLWSPDDPCFTISQGFDALFDSNLQNQPKTTISTRSKSGVSGVGKKRTDCIKCGSADEHEDHEDTLSDSEHENCVEIVIDEKNSVSTAENQKHLSRK